jgi:membrane fusion protein (multidrug efflux system)
MYRSKEFRRVQGLIFLFGSLIASGCSEDKSGGGGFSMPPIPVEVARAGQGMVQDRFEAIGTIEAIDAITVVAEIDAAVISIPFTEGSAVAKGELLAQLDDSQLAAEVARAGALLAQNRSSYERVKQVVEQKAAAPQDLDDAAAALKVAEANLDLARARFAKTRIIAPFDGIVGTRKISKGAFLRAGQAVTELANIDAIRVLFSAPERFLPLMKVGASVRVSTSAYGDFSMVGQILAIEPILDSQTRSARVVARVSNKGRKFRPGMSANVSAVLSQRDNAITIPAEAVFASGSESLVFVVNRDSTVARKALTLGTRMADVVEVLSGLDPDATVVRAGHQKLFEGAKVLPIGINSADTTK